jgi:DNA-binding transcriptional MerR regulator
MNKSSKIPGDQQRRQQQRRQRQTDGIGGTDPYPQFGSTAAERHSDPRHERQPRQQAGADGSYRINQLAELAGISPRTLRWFEHLGLLCPQRKENGYRCYGDAEVDRLQHILFYRELGLPLKTIAGLLDAEDFDDLQALEQHLAALERRRSELDGLIGTARRSIAERRKEIFMTTKEKFEGFKRQQIERNEELYGAEIREKYGDDTVDASNTRFAGMSQQQYAEMEELTGRLNAALVAAYADGQGDPRGLAATELCALHKQWLCIFWEKYSPEMHRGVTQMYVDDPRFTAHYDAIAPGSAVFLRDAVHAWLDGQGS